jgi:hypothetical protein
MDVYSSYYSTTAVQQTCTYTTYAYLRTYLLTYLLYATEKCDEGAADAETSLTKKSKK